MIFFFIIFTSLASVARSGLVAHDLGGDSDNYDKATSYQNIHMDHFHAVPTYIKKEYKHLLEHPISVGKSSSKVEIHHGGKHDHGYAIVDSINTAKGSALEGGHYGEHDDSHQSFANQGEGGLGHESAGASASLVGHDAAGEYQVEDHSQDLYLQHQVAQSSQGHGALQSRATAALVHEVANVGQNVASSSHSEADLGHYQLLAGGHQDYQAAYAHALQYQQAGSEGHGHGS